jgi:hypothetical protein
MAISNDKTIVRIFNQKDDDVTKQALDKGPPSETSSDSDEILLKVTRSAGDLSEGRKQKSPTPKLKAAVLRHTRARPATGGYPQPQPSTYSI